MRIGLFLVCLFWIASTGRCQTSLPEAFVEAQPYVNEKTVGLGVYRASKHTEVSIKAWARESGLPGYSSDVLGELQAILTEHEVEKVFVIGESHEKVMSGSFWFYLTTKKGKGLSQRLPGSREVPGGVLLATQGEATEMANFQPGRISGDLKEGLDSIGANDGMAMRLYADSPQLELVSNLLAKGVEEASGMQLMKALLPAKSCVVWGDMAKTSGGVGSQEWQVAFRFADAATAKKGETEWGQRLGRVKGPVNSPAWEVAGTRLGIRLASGRDLAWLMQASFGFNLPEGGAPMMRTKSASTSVESMKSILMAFHFYHDARRELPPQAIVDREGKKLLSWRVLLLPHLGEEALYKKFRLDEAWDSPHNLALLTEMPKVYQVGEEVNGKTRYVVPLREHSLFGRPGKPTTLRMVSDGTSNTVALLMVDRAHAVEWTKPEDLDMSKKLSCEMLEPTDEAFFLVGMLDGSITRIKRDLGEAEFGYLLDLDDGHPIDSKNVLAKP